MKTEWPADSVERRKLDDLVPYARNSNRHSDEQIDALSRSISEWGFTMPVLIDETGGIIAGHGRVMAAYRLGLQDVPCMVAKGWTENQKRAYVIADNRLAEMSSWDEGVLAFELDTLRKEDFEIELTGFDDPDIVDMIAETPELKHRVEQLQPISMTHVLVSLPTGVDPSFLKEAFETVKAKGGRVDYGGN